MKDRIIDLTKVKLYCRIDYDDDDELLRLMYACSIQEMQDLIDGFDPENMTARQEMILLCTMKSLYDDREKFAKSHEYMKTAISSMLLKEVYSGVPKN